MRDAPFADTRLEEAPIGDEPAELTADPLRELESNVDRIALELARAADCVVAFFLYEHSGHLPFAFCMAASCSHYQRWKNKTDHVTGKIFTLNLVENQPSRLPYLSTTVRSQEAICDQTTENDEKATTETRGKFTHLGRRFFEQFVPFMIVTDDLGNQGLWSRPKL